MDEIGRTDEPTGNLPETAENPTDQTVPAGPPEPEPAEPEPAEPPETASPELPEPPEPVPTEPPESGPATSTEVEAEPTDDSTDSASEPPGPTEEPTDSDEKEEKPWWDDPSLPWRHKPTRADLACWSWIAVVGVYGVVITLVRPVLIGWSPPSAAAITGGRTSVVATGAWLHVNGSPLSNWLISLFSLDSAHHGTAVIVALAVYWLVASLSLVKFSWVYWWAGHLWGTNVVDFLLAGRSARTKRRAERAVNITRRFRWLAIFLTFLPIPFPMPIVFAAIGAAGTSLKRFLPPVVIISAIFQAGYLALGWWIGQPAVTIVDIYAKYMWYVTIGMLVVVLVGYFWRRRATSTTNGQQ